MSPTCYHSDSQNTTDNHRDSGDAGDADDAGESTGPLTLTQDNDVVDDIIDIGHY